jgi:protein-S-isoprenylcysteine O-methyltransferase Ste14
VNTLARNAFVGIAKLMAVLGFLLFGSAWSLDYWQAWLYLLVFATCSGLITVYLLKNDRKLLERRIKAGPGAEHENTQKLIQLLASLVFMGAMILPSLDHRFSWSPAPLPVVILGEVLVALGFFIVFRVFKKNTFTAATIAVTHDQRLVSTGPYALVRHPMYSGALILLLGTPLALGSWWGLLMFIPMISIVAWRACEEEKFLYEHLSGYGEYSRKVRYRLVPFLW